MENISNYYQIIFKRLFNISANILEEYRFLLALEKNGNKACEEYNQHYKILKEHISAEKQVYESLRKNNDIIHGLLKKIAYFNKRATDFTIPKNDNSLIYTRMSLKLNNSLSDITKYKSPEVFALFNKFDLFSLIHFENVLFALILFKKFIRTNPDLVLEDILTTDLYSYSFMFPYIEDFLLKEDFTLPDHFYSITEWLNEQTVVDISINTFKQKKFDQITNYMKKNNLSTINYIFLLFYLKALSLDLDEEKTKEIEELIKKSGLKKDASTSLTAFIYGEDPTSLIRKVSFNI